MSNEIEATNIGPIDALSFQLQQHGVTVLCGANGKGKSILLDAIQKAMVGTGKVPLKDHTRKGRLDACGAAIIVGASSRHKGEFEVNNIQGALPLTALVDPGIKNAVAADRHRIKALVALTGVAASKDLFKELPEFDTIVTEKSLDTSDLVEMASRVKRDYEAEARRKADEAQRETGRARGHEEAADGVDTDCETDKELLQERYNDAKDALSKAQQAEETWQRQEKAALQAEEELKRATEEYEGPATPEEAVDEYDKAAKARETAKARVAELKEQLAEALAEQGRAESAATVARTEADRVSAHFKNLHGLKQTIAAFKSVAEKPDVAAAKQAAQAALDDMEAGTRARDALHHREQVECCKQAAAELLKKSEAYREAGALVDQVLSDAIKCPHLYVESDGEDSVLVCDHPERGKSVPYGELSDGERWKIAIDIGVDRVGENGLLVIEQPAWEGLDAFTRPIIDQHAKERKVYILTAEATRDESLGQDIVAQPYDTDEVASDEEGT